ncbi:MAG: MOSC domain-containing protein [Bacteroidetes bacterium]|nr:MOSC domain-containing protein [Bacteroidota bacterium]
MPKVLAINISYKQGISKTTIKKGLFIKDHGLENDIHAGRVAVRSVSLLGIESIKKIKIDMPLGQFAENITTEGINLYELPIGTKLQIGETLQKVTQIGKKCHDSCNIRKQFGNCIMPMEGIFTKILKGGVIKINDTITRY